MEHPLQHAVDSIVKSIKLNSLHLEIEKITELGKNFSDTISKLNEINKEPIVKLSAIGENLTSIIDGWKFINLGEEMKKRTNDLGIDTSNFNSSAGVSDNHFKNFNPIYIERLDDHSGIFWN